MLLLGSNQQKDVVDALRRKLREISGRLFISTSALWLLAALWLVEWLWALLAGITLKNMGIGMSIVVTTLLVGVLLDCWRRDKRSAQFVYFLAFLARPYESWCHFFVPLRDFQPPAFGPVI